ncbi:Glycerophosphoryl diester phosphodiesterase [Lunatimonas lonarensis]|uniref:Glycerophosphoryl diester phosphodiesterase n=2 Tax=Lunatimonas lonarensis TaxID=1232681 RepID=R7ZPB1_9BACT|nr:Glycerophosphoryl diester phosphodiesterase [Lunatimonas lonarensis]
MFVLGLPCYAQNKNPFHPYTLIAHRGGIVGSNTPENSLAALEEAIRRGYHRVEIDVRLSRDSVLITQHDPHFRKYFNLDRRASDMTWEEIRKLRHPSGHRILRLEEVLAACAGRIEVMLDNKIDGFDEALFAQIIQLLQTYGLQDNAMMIGTTASTEYFTGKVRLSCSIDQLKANQSRPDYSPNHYYLFARDLTKEDVEWAAQRGIPVVAAINAFLYPEDSLMETAAEKTTTMIKNGVRIFQIDGIFEAFFR